MGPQKIVYLGVAGGAFLFSCRAVWRERNRPMFAAGLPWLIASIVLITLILFSLPVSLANGTPITEWLRDAATYGLLAASPVFGLDAAASMRSVLLRALLLGTAALGTLSFAIYWITARDLAALPIDRLVLPTASLPTLLFVVSLAAAVVDRRHRLAWIATGGVVLGVLLFTGSRSAILYGVAFPVVMIIAGRSMLARSAVASAGIGVAAVAFVVLVQGAFAIPVSQSPAAVDPGAPAASAEQPAGPLPTPSLPTPRPALNPDASVIARIRALLADPARDPSIRERLSQYSVAWDLFASSPIVGTGLGQEFVWTRVDGTVRRDFTADTPLILPAKLGVLGIAWLMLFAFVWIDFVRKVRQVAGLTIPGLAMTAWGAILVVLSWGSFNPEDKGFSLGLMFALSLGFIEIERAERTDTG